ncbi:hypothetical protein SAMN04488105_104312 [Salipiger thiooxidans]|uniref:Class I SAM-dependent methyltransferase n=1 Tax=Salipiger thiooxidans TaxID=282683 RepID=A0A1G7DME1_9RHOB|nr:hypothetical protein SAMN04488105_104312 [Salipiger thiooxidans]
MPEAEAALLRELYAGAEVILEYGSGGSTALAAGMPGKSVFSVESDRDWAQMMRGWLAGNPPAMGTEVDIVWSDIGETKDWGHPVDESEWRRWPRYPLEVWELPEFRHPDVVLVDGRFREGCALAALFLAERPLTLLFDDYARRQHYTPGRGIPWPPRNDRASRPVRDHPAAGAAQAAAADHATDDAALNAA